jgi:hypothetical protein
MNWVLNGPWQRREVVWPSSRIFVGLIGIVLAYWGCSGTLDWTKQSWWVAIGSIALIVSMSGVAGFIKVGLRNLRHLQRLLLGTARAQFAGAAIAISADVRSAEAAGSSALVTVAGATVVHRADCLLVIGKAVSGVSHEDALAARLETCGMCGQ